MIGGPGPASGKGHHGQAETYLSGSVLSYSDKNGYGFIQIPGLPVDIRFGRDSFSGSSPPKGALVQCVLAASKDGRMHASIVVPMQQGVPGFAGYAAPGPGMPAAGMKRGASSQPSAPSHAPKQARTADVPVTSTGQWLTGTVKSYNVTKGWGLIESPGIPAGGPGQAGDVFFMKSNLPQEVRDQPLVGMTVSYELFQKTDGQYRAQNITVL